MRTLNRSLKTGCLKYLAALFEAFTKSVDSLGCKENALSPSVFSIGFLAGLSKVKALICSSPMMVLLTVDIKVPQNSGIRKSDLLRVHSCVHRMEGKSVLCLNVIPEFIIPIHINQKMVFVSGRMLWRRCCVLVGSSGNEKQTARKVTLSCPVHNTASLRWGELLLNADNALPVSIVLDPSVRIIMGELRGRSGPATKTRDRATGEGGREKK